MVVDLSQHDLDNGFTLKSDSAGEHPVYLYFDPANNIAQYSYKLTSLLDSPQIRNAIEISDQSISHLLTSGVVPPPYTVYKHLYIITIGHSATVTNANGTQYLKFEYSFPFMNDERHNSETFDEKIALALIASAVTSKLDPTMPSVLFQSAGKDSNIIALALAEQGIQNQIELITYAASGREDESKYARTIASKLGFRHSVTTIPEKLDAHHLSSIHRYFRNSPFPSTDRATLLFPLLAADGIQNNNVIDGMGNDVYIGHIPPRSEINKAQYSEYLEVLQCLLQLFPSESLVSSLNRTKAQVTCLTGLTDRDSNSIMPADFNNRRHWRDYSHQYRNLDYLDFRAQLRGGTVDTELFMRKVRNAGDVFNWNVIFPWANEEVAKYFFHMDESFLFDRKKLRNKIILRELLKNHNLIDSDTIGKMAFNFDTKKVLDQLGKSVSENIYECSYWTSGIKKLTERLEKRIKSNGARSGVAHFMLYRLYIVSAWLNHNKYANKLEQSC